ISRRRDRRHRSDRRSPRPDGRRWALRPHGFAGRADARGRDRGRGAGRGHRVPLADADAGRGGDRLRAGLGGVGGRQRSGLRLRGRSRRTALVGQGDGRSEHGTVRHVGAAGPRLRCARDRIRLPGVLRAHRLRPAAQPRNHSTPRHRSHNLKVHPGSLTCPGNDIESTSEGEGLVNNLFQENLREYIDKLRLEGYAVKDSQTTDPHLIDPMGRAVETWREGYPYDEQMDRDAYELEKYKLQVELLKFQYWGQDTGAKHVIVFEGRDAAGKGGTIKRFTEHLNPRAARVVALNKPS